MEFNEIRPEDKETQLANLGELLELVLSGEAWYSLVVLPRNDNHNKMQLKVGTNLRNAEEVALVLKLARVAIMQGAGLEDEPQEKVSVPADAVFH